MKSQTGELSSFQHGAIGAVVGSVEQALMRPSFYWKAELQQNRFSLARAFNPMYCYRGLAVAVASIAPITAVQFSSSHVYGKAIRRHRGTASDAPLSDVDAMTTGIAAGMTSSLVQSPFQLVEVNQQRSGGNMFSTARQVIAAHGVTGLFRGQTMTAVREGIFCCSYAAVAPILKRKILEKRPDLPEGQALAAASIASGSFGAFLSHPFDTLKTRLQGSVMDAGRVSGPREAFLELRQQGGGYGQFFNGFVPRVFRICCCTFIYASMSETLGDWVREFNRSGLRGELSYLEPGMVEPSTLGELAVM
jgi:hypothetical protein